MTWSARITDQAGEVPTGKYHACQSCTHESVCRLPMLAAQVGYLLTCQDIDCKGHMASGSAELKCNGFEAKEEPKVDTTHG